jgi:hypothetical protein
MKITNPYFYLNTTDMKYHIARARRCRFGFSLFVADKARLE